MPDRRTPLIPASNILLSPAQAKRRRLLIAGGSGLMLGACGGGTGDEAQSTTASLLETGAPEMSPAAYITNAADWERLRDREKAVMMGVLNQSNYRRPASNLPQALAEAVQASLQDGRPIKLLPGVTELDQVLDLRTSGPKRKVTIFSDGDHCFRGRHPVQTRLPLQIYNCCFEQASRQIVSAYVNDLLLWFNTFSNSKSESVFLQALALDEGFNRLSMRWNDFSGHRYALMANDMNDSLIEHNRCRQSVGRNFQCNGGYGNHFINNVIHGGVTGIANLIHGIPKPGSEEHSRAYNQSHLDTVIEGNILTDITEEAIGFDAFGNNAYSHPVVDQFTLARYYGSHGKIGTKESPSILVPRNPGGASAGPIPEDENVYRHYFVVWLTGPLAGKYAQIHRSFVHGSSGLVGFSLRSPRWAANQIRSASDPALRPGELTQEDFGAIQDNVMVNICSLAANFRIRYNRIECSSFASKFTTAISMWGGCSGFTVANNTLADVGVQPERRRFAGIRLSHLAGFHPKVNKAGVRTAYGSHTLCTSPVAYARVENNALGGLGIRMHNEPYSGAGGIVRAIHQSAVSGNTNVFGGAPEIANWTYRISSTEHAVIHPAMPTFVNNAANVSGNS
ncbi:hypothetical protein [Noviherbaspirillum aerium]|uniref:hypothetical protein n=1 Tax=Noviherbaspirillum aerium TaxID=2588497 RepID=UPI00124F7655|nr:hypothetical protein [Noviherbaspirillum aerium]